MLKTEITFSPLSLPNYCTQSEGFQGCAASTKDGRSDVSSGCRLLSMRQARHWRATLLPINRANMAASSQLWAPFRPWGGVQRTSALPPADVLLCAAPERSNPRAFLKRFREAALWRLLQVSTFGDRLQSFPWLEKNCRNPRRDELQESENVLLAALPAGFLFQATVSTAGRVVARWQQTPACWLPSGFAGRVILP